MDRDAINRAMNDKRLFRQIRPTEPGSWTRLLEAALAAPQGWGGYDLVSLLQVAYDIGHQDGESEADMYGKEARLRELCDEHMTDDVNGGRIDASELWPSWVLAILDEDS